MQNINKKGLFMEDKTIIAISGLICITALEAMALYQGKFNGAILSSVVGAIAGIVGLAFGVKIGEKKTSG